MTRLLVRVEGQTEESFVNEVLKPYLCTQGFADVNPRILGNARPRSQRGGVGAWTSARKDITSHLKQDLRCIVTTMVDYYGTPKSWPRRIEAGKLTFPNNVQTVENALASDVCDQMGENFNSERFVPYVMMHEFEALLFSDCKRFAEGIGKPELAPKFQEILAEFGCPEEINDSPNTAPSIRIESLVPGYKSHIWERWQCWRLVSLQFGRNVRIFAVGWNGWKAYHAVWLCRRARWSSAEQSLDRTQSYLSSRH